MYFSVLNSLYKIGSNNLFLVKIALQYSTNWLSYDLLDFLEDVEIVNKFVDNLNQLHGGLRPTDAQCSTDKPRS